MDLNRLAALRSLVAGMEHDLGLDDLSEAQRDILYAAHLLVSNKNTLISTKILRNHQLTQHLTHATFFRALGKLVDRGFLYRNDTREGYLLL